MFQPSNDEWKMIREVAFRGYSVGEDGLPMKRVDHVQLELRKSYNLLNPSKPESINMLLVTDDPETCGDCDLVDSNTALTQQFRNGVDLTADGAGLFDFYIYNRYDRDHTLGGNVLVRVKQGKMVAIWTEGGKAWGWTASMGLSPMGNDSRSSMAQIG